MQLIELQPQPSSVIVFLETCVSLLAGKQLLNVCVYRQSYVYNVSLAFGFHCYYNMELITDLCSPINGSRNKSTEILQKLD